MKPTLLAFCVALSFNAMATVSATSTQTSQTQKLPVIEAELTVAPHVPAPITRNYPARVLVNLEVQEKIMPITEGVDYKYWTFNGSTPGPFIRVREGDTVEVKLANPPTSRMPHSIDFHAVSGQNGGVQASETMPNKMTTFAFKAVYPGLYLYHCGSTPSASIHLSKGMFGLILVEPKEGLSKADKEYFIVQNEFYINESGADPHSSVSQKVTQNNERLVTMDMAKAMAEQPDFVVFNGHAGTLLDNNALKAKVGDKVRLFVGNAGPNLASSFHIMGKVMDNVQVEGGSVQNHNVQTTLIPAGGATIIDLNMQTPGKYMFVDHSLFRSMKGAMGEIVVDGEPNLELFEGRIKTEPYQSLIK
ncbi:copper-containing nitrite reductase [Cricetibacter osteomyelitidis]|uniref:copper-containing nitrite reductase n=1 Tax=Cricetibacter osteomyelitidis TaxID=1521931 RepID=UPI003C77E51B